VPVYGLYLSGPKQSSEEDDRYFISLQLSQNQINSSQILALLTAVTSRAIGEYSSFISSPMIELLDDYTVS
jgi:hypothetical protein